MTSKIHTLAATVLLAASSAAMADTALYTSLDFLDPSSPAQPGWCSTCSGYQIIGDKFTLSAASTVKSTDFAIMSSYGSSWNINVGIYDANQHQIALSTSAPGSYSTASVGDNVTMVHANLPGVSLAAGTYYMAWYDNNNMAIPGYVGSSTTQFNFTGGQEIGGYGSAFRVNGVVNAVPEPATYAMLLAGLGMLAFAARRRAR